MSEEKLTGKEKLDIAVESGLQLIPYIGGPLATAYFGTKNEKRFKRIETFYEEFANKMQEIDYRFKSITVHDEDALIAIIERLNEKIEQEVIEEKRSFFRNFLLHTLDSPTTHQNFDERKFFIDTLADMTLLELELISFLSTQPEIIRVGTISKPGVDQGVIIGAIGRLKNYGFIFAETKYFKVGGDNSNNALNEDISINEFGKRFFNYCLTV